MGYSWCASVILGDQAIGQASSAMKTKLGTITKASRRSSITNLRAMATGG